MVTFDAPGNHSQALALLLYLLAAEDTEGVELVGREILGGWHHLDTQGRVIDVWRADIR